MLRHLLVAAGWLFVAAGFLGIFLPLLPTTPFLLLAAFCFSKGSVRCHQWLLRSPRFGPYLAAWRDRGAIPLRAKLLAAALMAGSVALIWSTLHSSPVAASFATFVCAAVLLFIWTRPD